MRRLVVPAVALALLAGAAPAASAQSFTASNAPVAAPVAGFGAVSAPSVTVAGRLALEEARAPLAAAAQSGRKSFGQSEALMIVGGAMIIGGIVVGGGAGYVISVVGLGVGIYGLYQYLQQ